MRYITGDECGLIKEYNTTKYERYEQTILRGASSDKYAGNTTSTLQMVQQQQQQDSIYRINTNDAMTRQHGILRMIPITNHSMDRSSDDTSSSSSCTFAALRMNGTIQLWEHERYIKRSNHNNNNNHTNHNNNTSMKYSYKYHHLSTTPNVYQNTTTTINNNNSSSLEQPQPAVCERPFTMDTIQYISSSSSIPSKLVTCSRNGTIGIIDPNHNLNDNDTTTNNNHNVPIVMTPFQPSTNKNNTNITNPTPNSIVSTFNTHPNNGWIVLGGKERDIMIYDLNTLSSSTTSSTNIPLWKAKNLPPNSQTFLLSQIYPTITCFMNLHGTDLYHTTSNQQVHDQQQHSNILVVGTAYQQIRIYDIRTSQSVGTILQSQQQPPPQRRPIAYTSDHRNETICDYRITALCPIPHINSYTIAIGDGGGTILSYDLRQISQITNHSSSKSSGIQLSKSSILGRYIGPAGCIKQLISYKNQLACVGYDRMLRIYDIHTKQQIHKVYMKQRLNCLCIIPTLEDDNHDMDQNNHNHDEYDIDQEDNVHDYIDSDDNDDESSDVHDENDDDENEDDIVEEMMVKYNHERDDDDIDDDDDESDDDDDDDDDDHDDDMQEQYVSKKPPRKRNRRQ